MRFRKDYYFLSNMYPCTLTMVIDGKTYRFLSSEAAFQAMKCPMRASEFIILDGYEAKRKGKLVKMRADWDKVKVDTMRTILWVKFIQNPDLMTKLLAIDGPIVEENTHGDEFWGVNECTGQGTNWLGILLMDLRDKFNSLKGVIGT